MEDMALPPAPLDPAGPAGDRPAKAEPVLPERSFEDTDAAWGDRPGPDDDERLLADRPPHWDNY
jgi:hypothetical protein